MKRKLIILGAIFVVAAALAAFYQFQPDRLTKEVLLKATDTQKQLDEKNAPKPEASPAQPGEMKAATPISVVAATAKPQSDTFKVKFECSNGNFVVEVHRDWAPVGVRRFEELVKAGFYNENRFFRVLSGFVAQFGLSGDPALNAEWRERQIVDDPVVKSNLKGYLTFATSGKNSRTTQLFINLVDNTQKLDHLGFAPFGVVIEGMDVVEKINPEYEQSAIQGMIQDMGNEYLKKGFPRMDYIKTATILP